MLPSVSTARSAFVYLVAIVALLLLGHFSGSEPRLDAVAAAEHATGLTLETGTIDVGEVRLHVVQVGPQGGPPIVLLHGFPEFWYAWSEVMAPLVAAGHRVIVPDQRGYGDSDKPREVGAYGVDRLGDDIAGLVAALGLESACVVAHDWGGGVAWNLAIRHPERVRRLVILGVPHPDAGRRGPTKEKKIAWYRTVFQIPLLPEWVARLSHWALVSRMLRDTSEPGTFPEQKLALYRSAWDRDGAFGTMVNWYRANAGSNAQGPERRVRIPTLILLAPRDAFIPADLARASLPLLDDGRLVELPEGTHWVMQEHPDVVAREVIAFCRPGA